MTSCPQKKRLVEKDWKRFKHTRVVHLSETQNYKLFHGLQKAIIQLSCNIACIYSCLTMDFLCFRGSLYLLQVQLDND